MEIKTIDEYSRTFDVVVVHKGKEQEVRVTRQLSPIDGKASTLWRMNTVGEGTVEQSIRDFLVDAINSYVKTGKIPKAPMEVAYTTLEHRHWICPFCGRKNATAEVEQGYPLPKCHFCGEQHDWGEGDE